jgi:hypothetical protein
MIHGEATIIKLNEAPKGLTFKKATQAIIAHSESGHNHVLERLGEGVSDIQIATDSEGNTYFKVIGEAQIKHKKSFDIHETTKVSEGVYIVGIEREYDPYNDVVRKSWD